MKSNSKNVIAIALILFPAIAFSTPRKKRNFEVIQPKQQVIKVIIKDTEPVRRNKRRFKVIQPKQQVIKVIIKDSRTICKGPQVFYGPHGKIELPFESSEPENSLFPTLSFK